MDELDRIKLQIREENREQISLIFDRNIGDIGEI